ncbi:hypothetical protein PAXRUDRAFT_652981 [Paxillus rubicundulus Ve08.2h10]|uniref:Uncharacterized protein n=1 Tax=Paxillus rubicundulus Ve08.2h10 TaxID=930991 RepID=A0A0D0DIY9_9AGAM|nr:hypothetical protein PAXRUDRAFT_652981 [Paxillus rubicundulus Ve08.2h10]
MRGRRDIQYMVEHSRESGSNISVDRSSQTLYISTRHVCMCIRMNGMGRVVSGLLQLLLTAHGK